VKDLGATYHSDPDTILNTCEQFELAMECTGAPAVIASLMSCIARDGILCLSGVSTGGRKIPLDIGKLNREIVLENEVIFGSVNANLRHFKAAAQSLAEADPAWLSRMITRRVPLSRWQEAFHREKNDVKTVIVGEN
jgi:threonine dehydrogenase-like Zn-dependent dehydrogenase